MDGATLFDEPASLPEAPSFPVAAARLGPLVEQWAEHLRSFERFDLPAHLLRTA
jgi:hypothetical protein